MLQKAIKHLVKAQTKPVSVICWGLCDNKDYLQLRENPRPDAVNNLLKKLVAIHTDVRRDVITSVNVNSAANAGFAKMQLTTELSFRF